MPREMLHTTDRNIRLALRKFLNNSAGRHQTFRGNPFVFEELGIRHGATRIDFALLNGTMHGFEIKSDSDTLNRLPEQVKEFSAVFDSLTLVVGKRHLYQAIHMIPDWWGVIVAKVYHQNCVILQSIREPEMNQDQEAISIARLLWKQEVLRLLEERDLAAGVRHKTREALYAKLAENLNITEMRDQVSSLLIKREGWRSVLQLTSNGG